MNLSSLVRSIFLRLATLTVATDSKASFIAYASAATGLSSILAVVIVIVLHALIDGPMFDMSLPGMAVVGALTSFIVATPMIIIVRMAFDLLDKSQHELEVAVAQAEAASKAKSAFLANMSHEIRTPLNGVLGMAQILQSTDLDDRQREFVDTIRDSGGTLTTLLNDVLDIAKIEAGKFDIVPSDVDLEDMMRREVQLWSARASEKFLNLTLSIDDDVPSWLSFDKVRVQQCTSNLISNAIKFTKTGGVEVRVRQRATDDAAHLIEISVKDTGPGLDKEALSKLFQPFVQADETIARQYGGTGLGLSITRRLAELMGGTASAISTPGNGSTFSFSFRACEAASGDSQLERQLKDSEVVRRELAASNLRILIADDIAINRHIASLFVTPLGAEIAEAENGVEALAMLEERPFDVVLLDMQMPVMDGPETIKNIRDADAVWKAVPLVAVTADAMSGDRERYLEYGADGYVSKPLDERDLLSEIWRVTSRRRTAYNPASDAIKEQIETPRQAQQHA